MKRAVWLSLVVWLMSSSANAFAASVTLAWDAEPGLRYMVFYGTESRVYTQSVDAKDQNSVVINGLADNQVYYFAVRSYNEKGQMSGFSSEVCNAEPGLRPVDHKETGTPESLQLQGAVPRPAATNDAAPRVTGAGTLAGPAATSKSASSMPPVTPPAGAASSGPPGYLIGPSDVLTVTFWRDKDMDTEVVVRPDGNITLPLLNDIQAAGLTPGELRERIVAEAHRYIEDPSPTVAVKAINSRKVFITGQVEKPGPYPLASPMTVLQLIALAGGLKEFADGKNILVMRAENGRQVAYQFDYKELLKRKNLRQNIDLKPGDTVVVP
jgi:polysaccharide export outer membrane protein